MQPVTQQSRPGVDVDRGRRIIGLAGMLVSGAYLYFGRELSLGELDRPGAGLFPTLIGGFSLLVCALIVLGSLRGSATGPAGTGTGTAKGTGTGNNTDNVSDHDNEPTAQDRSRLRAVLLVALLVAYVVILPLIGFIPTSIGFVFLFGLIVKRDLRWLPFAVYSCGSVFALHYLFTEVLFVRLP